MISPQELKNPGESICLTPQQISLLADERYKGVVVQKDPNGAVLLEAHNLGMLNSTGSTTSVYGHSKYR
ncbi:hypothetical protein T265_04603 [Opisthorchis viverrini]|uniref:Uncharacterized protein n=1 Tax=Opisthorchis viverrini TaxID=6198 RepID=A0A075AGA4_OPIVI|nr:hypothetical protein T265_04603 [Opisthorchis viverrini]KER28554.1 hypothetical protein T265_04603 [Opisthorchis viverrini]